MLSRCDAQPSPLRDIANSSGLSCRASENKDIQITREKFLIFGTRREIKNLSCCTCIAGSVVRIKRDLSQVVPSRSGKLCNYAWGHSCARMESGTVARQNYSVQSRADGEKIVKANEKTLAKSGEWEKRREEGGKRKAMRKR